MLLILMNMVLFTALLYLPIYLKKKKFKFHHRVLLSMGVAILFGLYLLNYSQEIIDSTMVYVNIFGEIYIRLLRMVVYPLLVVAIITSIINLSDFKQVGKITGMIIGLLVVTVTIAGLVGGLTALLFGLDASSLTATAASGERAAALAASAAGYSSVSDIIVNLVNIIPLNPFEDLAGARSQSTMATVFTSIFVGFATLTVMGRSPEKVQPFVDIMNASKEVVMSVTRYVLRFTPYGIISLMTSFVANSDWDSIQQMILFVAANYVALGAVFVIHLIIIASLKLNPMIYLRKFFPTMLFAFTSRSSMATLPLTIQTQKDLLGVDEGTASISSSLGTSIGQNGCAGVYPAMLVFMVAPTVGINPMEPFFLLSMLVVIAIGSFGIAGVGGGATFAAIVVFSAMGLPIELIALLVAIEPIIDMARTAINVSGSIVVGLLTSSVNKTLNREDYNNPDIALESNSQMEEI